MARVLNYRLTAPDNATLILQKYRLLKFIIFGPFLKWLPAVIIR